MAEPTTGPVTISPLAGKRAPKEMLVDLARLERDRAHLDAIVTEARAIVDRAMGFAA